jgi:hypothetical protein
MQHSVRAGVQEARALRHIRQQVKEPLPGPAHRKLSVSAVAVQEERLAEDRQVPMDQEKQDDGHVLDSFGSGQGMPDASKLGHSIRRVAHASVTSLLARQSFVTAA